MRKGFMHIVEIVIISLMVIVIIGQLYGNMPVQSTWEKAQLRALAEDILHSLEARNVNWTKSGGHEAEARIMKILENTTIIFDLSIENLPKPDILVGCICNDAEFNSLRQMIAFSPTTDKVVFDLNQLDNSITLKKVYNTYGDVTPATFEFPMIYDVVIVCDSGFRRLVYSKGRLENYLQEGKGVILMADLSFDDFRYDDPETQPVENRPRILPEIFGLEEVESSSSDVHMSMKSNPDSRYYNIRKYFLAIPNATGSMCDTDLDCFINDTFLFTNFLSSDEKVAAENLEEEKELLTTFTGSPTLSALVVNDKIIKEKGRAAWISDGVSAGEEEEKGVLLKSLILWVSGEKFIITSNYLRRPEGAYIIDSIQRMPTTIRSPDAEFLVQQKSTFFHPIKVVLSLAYALK